MRKILYLAAILALAVSCSENKAPKALVLYYSQTSTTKAVAQQISDLLDADIEEIVPINPFDGDFDATIQRCKELLADTILLHRP